MCAEIKSHTSPRHSRLLVCIFPRTGFHNSLTKRSKREAQPPSPRDPAFLSLPSKTPVASWLSSPGHNPATGPSPAGSRRKGRTRRTRRLCVITCTINVRKARRMVGAWQNVPLPLRLNADYFALYEHCCNSVPPTDSENYGLHWPMLPNFGGGFL